MFSPRAGIFNVLFTTFEAEILPDEYRPACHSADLVVVPSRHNLRVFAAAGVFAERCPLGIDRNCFRFVERRSPGRGERFRYLWVGAPNPRKGWPILDRAWKLEFERDSQVELYVKTTCADGSLQRAGNGDRRRTLLDRSTTRGALRLGALLRLPQLRRRVRFDAGGSDGDRLAVIFTSYGGVCDFAGRDNAYPLKKRMIAVEYFGRKLTAATEPVVLAAEMRRVQRNYPHALASGRRAAAELACNLTWRKAALNLVAIVSARLAHASAA